MSNPNPDKSVQYQCRHIFTDGHRCGSRCLRNEHFCYYHHTTRPPVANPLERRSRRSAFTLPLPEDRSAIQLAIGQVLLRIAGNQVDTRRAALLLYGLQIASTNIKREKAPAQIPAQTVDEITIDETLGLLAPIAEIIRPEDKPSDEGILLDKWYAEALAAGDPGDSADEDWVDIDATSEPERTSAASRATRSKPLRLATPQNHSQTRRRPHPAVRIEAVPALPPARAFYPQAAYPSEQATSESKESTVGETRPFFVHQ